ncbi:MAG: hypothetical protein ACPL88_11130, partial [Bryobacteraceae bacterium]
MRRYAFLLVATLGWAQAPSELEFLASHTDYREIRNMLPAWLKRLAAERLAERQRQIERLGPGNLEERRKRVREA